MTTLIPLRILCWGARTLCVLFNHTRKCRKNQEDSFRKIKKLRRGGLVRGSGTKVTVIGALNKSVSVYCGNLVTLPKMQKSPRSAEQKRHCAVLTNNQGRAAVSGGIRKARRAKTFFACCSGLMQVPFGTVTESVALAQRNLEYFPVYRSAVLCYHA